MKIVNAIKNRLPGSALYEAYARFPKLRHFPADPLEAALLQKKKCIGAHFFLFSNVQKSRKLFHDLYMHIYQALFDEFTSAETPDRFDFEGIKLPHVMAENDRVTFAMEFAPKIAICTYHMPDDPSVLRELILQANPAYRIEEKWKKMYAHVPQQRS